MAGVVVQPACRQGFVDLFPKGLVLVHVVIGFGEVEETGAAGRHDGLGAVGLLFRQGQVAGDERIGRQPFQ